VNETRVVKALTDEISKLKDDILRLQFSQDGNIAYQLGLRQGKYNGLNTALQLMLYEQKDEARGELRQ